jgi:hypothetical protein
MHFLIFLLYPVVRSIINYSWPVVDLTDTGHSLRFLFVFYYCMIV